jgi:hypothetical protein
MSGQTWKRRAMWAGAVLGVSAALTVGWWGREEYRRRDRRMRTLLTLQMGGVAERVAALRSAPRLGDDMAREAALVGLRERTPEAGPVREEALLVLAVAGLDADAARVREFLTDPDPAVQYRAGRCLVAITGNGAVKEAAAAGPGSVAAVAGACMQAALAGDGERFREFLALRWRTPPPTWRLYEQDLAELLAPLRAACGFAPDSRPVGGVAPAEAYLWAATRLSAGQFSALRTATLRQRNRMTYVTKLRHCDEWVQEFFTGGAEP